MAGEPATAYPMAAVTPRPTNIHPYTVRRNAVTRSAATSAVTGGIRVAMESCSRLGSRCRNSACTIKAVYLTGFRCCAVGARGP